MIVVEPTAEDRERTQQAINSGEEALAALLAVGAELRLTVDILVKVVRKDHQHERTDDDR